MEELKGRLSADGNRAGPVRGKAGLTARRTCRADAKAGPSEPMAMLVLRTGTRILRITRGFYGIVSVLSVAIRFIRVPVRSIGAY